MAYRRVDPARGRGIGTVLTWARLRRAFTRTSTVFYVTGADNGTNGEPLLTAAGIRRVCVHKARHTAVALLLAQGVAVMEILGHSQISMISRYAATSSRR